MEVEQIRQAKEAGIKEMQKEFQQFLHVFKNYSDKKEQIDLEHLEIRYSTKKKIAEQADLCKKRKAQLEAIFD